MSHRLIRCTPALLLLAMAPAWAQTPSPGLKPAAAPAGPSVVAAPKPDPLAAPALPAPATSVPAASVGTPAPVSAPAKTLGDLAVRPLGAPASAPPVGPAAGPLNAPAANAPAANAPSGPSGSPEANLLEASRLQGSMALIKMQQQLEQLQGDRLRQQVKLQEDLAKGASPTGGKDKGSDDHTSASAVGMPTMPPMVSSTYLLGDAYAAQMYVDGQVVSVSVGTVLPNGQRVSKITNGGVYVGKGQFIPVRGAATSWGAPAVAPTGR